VKLIIVIYYTSGKKYFNSFISQSLFKMKLGSFFTKQIFISKELLGYRSGYILLFLSDHHTVISIRFTELSTIMITIERNKA
jgi:hypothetical protein